jgi:hypothetical protein
MCNNTVDGTPDPGATAGRPPSYDPRNDGRRFSRNARIPSW